MTAYAYACVKPDGTIQTDTVCPDQAHAERKAWAGETVRRVAIVLADEPSAAVE